MLCVSVGLPLLPLQDSLQEGHVALGEDQLLKLVAGHAGALGPQDIPGRAEHALHVSVLASLSLYCRAAYTVDRLPFFHHPVLHFIV